MSEYNIQMNKYNALNAGYDQLYPATKIENVDGLNEALQNKADTSSVYTKTESDTLLAGKAPAGYGLGTNAKDISGVDFNTVIDNGWYSFTTAGENRPYDQFGYSYMLVSNRNNENLTQIVFVGNAADYAGCIVKRVNLSGTWYPWEWVNPPMYLDVEYRTTERYLGKPVYCMTKFVGEVAANTVTQVIFTSSDIGKYCIRAFCTGKRTFSNWVDSETSMVSSPAGSDTIITCDPAIYRLREGYRSIRAYIKSSANLKDVYCTAYYTKWAD